MAKDAYWKDIYAKAQQQLRELRDDRDERTAELEELNREIIQLEGLLQHVAPFVPDSKSIVVIAEGIAEMGLANACREVLKQSDQFRTPRGVRDSLEASGYDLKQHNNALASVHGILKRLVEAGEVEPNETAGKTRYRWKTRNPLQENKERLLDLLRGSEEQLPGPKRTSFKERLTSGGKKD